MRKLIARFDMRHTALAEITKTQIALFAALCLSSFLVLSHDAQSSPSINWMNIWQVSDFKTPAELLTYLRDLRTGVSPVLSMLEIFVFQWTGSIHWVTLEGYQGALILAFWLPIALFAKSPLGVLFSELVALTFLEATLAIHPGNPQSYDVFFPVLVLLFLFCYKLSTDIRIRSDRLAIASAFFAGCFLSIAELSRPFFIFALFVVVPAAYFGFSRLNRKAFWVFILPVVIFSGGWHLKQ